MGDLYPDINDPTFNVKIAERKEFNENSMVLPRNPEKVKEEAEKMCFASFELSPHQQFVKNFLSVHTPYNSLLLFHGLGTGKTCSAIGVSEEMRNYMKQMGITKKIIVVASPNVQENFKQQLFDERKMKKVGGIWSITGCSGHRFLAEINPINLKGLSREKIVRQVERIIRSYYLFMGYGEFANFITKRSNVPDEYSEEQKEKIRRRKLQDTFANRLIIIDEVHNIRSSDNKKEKRVASRLDMLVKYVHPLRLLLLSATPMYNDPKEIVWLVNLMNKNDGRSVLDSREIFDTQGNFIEAADGSESGKELLMRKATGYVSFVKGDNPYSFPYRIFPNDYKSPNSLKVTSYPRQTILGGQIVQPMEHLDLYCVGTGSYQATVYQHIIKAIREKTESGKLAPENMERFGYTLLQRPLEALNMTYPIGDDEALSDVSINSLVGIEGLNRVMTFRKNKTEYEYRPGVEHIFEKKHLRKYSAKLHQIVDAIINAEGICLVYSQFLDGGVVPLALALEEQGCSRFDGPNLLQDSSKKKSKITYTMITGNEDLSPNNALAVKKASDESNKDGSIIKIIIISRAGSEGLDFANIRQVHILEPWYNTNRIEQTIGRAVRNCSHKNLPFDQRNVMIFLYATLLKNDMEAADMYVYRVAELKAILIGRVTRALKEGAIDCLLNQSQQGTSAEALKLTQKLLLSNGEKIDYQIGDKPFTQQCDYMESCSYTCLPNASIKPEDVKLDTYFVPSNESLLIKIKSLFKEHYFYTKDDLVRMVTYVKPYSIQQIDVALQKLVSDKTEIVEDRYGRAGTLINVGEYYIFQPLELDNQHASVFARDRPIEYKRGKIVLEGAEDKGELGLATKVPRETSEKIIAAMTSDYERAFEPDPKLKKSEKDWYKNAANAIVRLQVGGMKRSLLQDFVVSHIWQVASGTEKLAVLNYLSTLKSEGTKFEKKLKAVVKASMFTFRGSTQGIYLQEGSNFVLYVKEDGSNWKKGEKTDNDEFTPLFVKQVSARIKDLNDIYGFIIPFKDTNELIFKTKIKTQKRQSGARCDQASKKETIKSLNEILKSAKRSEGCPTQMFDEETVKAVGNVELCCYTELVLRCYNHHKVHGNTWFVEPEFAQPILNHLKEN